MNIKINTLSVVLFCALLAGCTSGESPYGPQTASSTTISSSNLIASAGLSLGVETTPTVFTLSGAGATIDTAPIPLDGWVTAACSDIDSIDGSQTATITVTARDNSNAPVSSGTIYFRSQWGSIYPTQCEIVEGSCSVEWSAQTNIEKLASISNAECYINNGVVDLLDSITAWTYGVESFTETNGDLILSVGESFINVEEPYLDRNDNNSFDNDDNVIDKLILNGTHDTGDTDYNGPECDAVNRTDCAGAGLIPIFTKLYLKLY